MRFRGHGFIFLTDYSRNSKSFGIRSRKREVPGNGRLSRSLGAFIAATLAGVCQRRCPESFRVHEYFIKAITDAFMESHRPAPPPPPLPSS